MKEIPTLDNRRKDDIKFNNQKSTTESSETSIFSRWNHSKPKAIFNRFGWRVQFDPRDMFLDRWIRGERKDTTNERKVRCDKDSHRWYLKLSALDVKEIRAKVWQRQGIE